MVAFATQVKRRRGTTAQNDAFTGAEGEIVVDTERHELRVHDGVTMGGFKIGGSTSLPLLTPMWFDHIANDVSWLRADTFSWQPGDVYVAAYNHLLNDLDGKIAQNETIGDITISYYLSDDGHKICTPDQESNLVALYEATGVAWYYILDVINKRFKLPRTKWGFTGIRNGVGEYVPQNVLLPNITGYASFSANGSTNYLLGVVNTGGALYGSTDVSSSSGGGGGNNHSGAKRLRLDASRSSSVYSGNGTNTLIQPRGTQMYLYFYVGNFAQSAIEQTAGLNAEMFNSLNAHKVIAFQAPTSANNYTWYRKYADGWVEQGGTVTTASDAATPVTLPIPMVPNRFFITNSSRQPINNWSAVPTVKKGEDGTKIAVAIVPASGSGAWVSGTIDWQVSGVSA